MPIPITLVTGFLGSGKTTLLRQVARRYPDKNFVFLVNEFSPHGMDPTLLEGTGIPVISVKGGSIFCKCKVGDFLAHLKNFPDRFRSKEKKIDGLFIETSGLADPRVIHRLLKETGLDAEFSVRHIAAIVVAARFLAVVNTLSVVRAQVETADKVILNKLDISKPEEIDEAITVIREINPSVSIVRTSHCDIDLLAHGESGGRQVDGELTTRANPYSTFELPVNKMVDPIQLSESLAALGDSVYRAKGFLPQPGVGSGWAYFDWTQDGWSTNPIADDKEQGLLIILVSDAEEKNLSGKIAELGENL